MNIDTSSIMRTARSLSSKVPPSVKRGLGATTTVFGAYAAYLAIIYGAQYVREKSRPFNASSTSDDVMKHVNLSGKYAIVTGCNTGIGKETARSLVAAGATVVMACRNLKKAQKAKADIIATFEDNNNVKDRISERLIIMQLDLGSLESVYGFSKAFVESGLKCDYLVNNAGIMMLPEYRTTTENIERQWGVYILCNEHTTCKMSQFCVSLYLCYLGVNHLGHFYLTTLLLEPVLIPNKTRIISLTSYGHRFAGSYNNLNNIFTKAIEDGDYMGSQKDTYAPLFSYGIAKASNILFARELNTLYKDKGIISVSVHPGFITETELIRNIAPNMTTVREMTQFIPLYTLTPFVMVESKNIKQGAATTLRCITMSNDEIIGGELYWNCIPSSIENRTFDNCKVKGDDDVLAKKLWILSEKIIKTKGFKSKL